MGGSTPSGWKKVPKKLRGKSETDTDRCIFRKLYAATSIILMCRTASDLARADDENQDENHQAVFEAFCQVLKTLHSILDLSADDFRQGP